MKRRSILGLEQSHDNRPIRPEDYDAWRPLWYGYLEFYETSVDDAVYDLTFDRLTSSDHPNQCAFVAEIEGALVGLVHYIIHPHNQVEDVIYLQDLFTIGITAIKALPAPSSKQSIKLQMTTPPRQFTGLHKSLTIQHAGFMTKSQM